MSVNSQTSSKYKVPMVKAAKTTEIKVPMLEGTDMTNHNGDSVLSDITTGPLLYDHYPVIIRLNDSDSTIKAINRNIKAGLKAVQAMSDRDVNAISLAHSISVRDPNGESGVRLIRLQNSAVYWLEDYLRLNGLGDLVILPRNVVPEVRAALKSSILVDSEYTASLIERHDQLYSNIN